MRNKKHIPDNIHEEKLLIKGVYLKSYEPEEEQICDHCDQNSPYTSF